MSSSRAALRKAKRTKVDGRLVHPDAPHGTDGGYCNYGCRCEGCTSAHAESVMARKRKWYAQRIMVEGRLVHLDAPHGKPSTYDNYGCQCSPCVEASGIKNPDLIGQRDPDRTECNNGHAINNENTRFTWGKDGEFVRWRCRVCEREQVALRRRLKAARKPQV